MMKFYRYASTGSKLLENRHNLTGIQVFFDPVPNAFGTAKKVTIKPTSPTVG
ncbi:MAG: hypothetical protein QME25_04935 [Bacteroidota bacterium]|nr:hypothetical protein [Bacteroidota bacterium]